MRAHQLLRLVLIAVALAAPARASAQVVLVSAVINPDPTSGSGVRPLQFGTNDAPFVSTVMPAEAAAGQWTVSGYSKSKSVAISFVLPDSLATADGAQAAVSWDGAHYAAACARTNASTCTSASATWRAWAPQSAPGAANTFNYYLKQVGQNASVIPSGQTFNGTIDIYLGGRFSVPAAARAGIYRGTATVVVVATN